MTDIFRGGDPIVITTGGLRGPTGQGVATGGTAGQYLRKQSGTNYDTAWASIPITDVTGLQAALDDASDYISQTGWINVIDDANILPNLGDVWEALQAVVDNAAGEAVVYMPPGLYPLSQELKLPDNTVLRGAGKYVTILKLMDTADADQNVITNSENTRDSGTNGGNTSIMIADLMVDGNSARTGVGSIGSHTAGCGIGFATVTNSTIQNVHSQNCKKHCFDIAAAMYNKSGDDPETYQSGPSRNIAVLECSGTNSGDDIITTHFSTNIYIRNAYCYASGGQLVATNSNGIEIDDGSYDVLVEGGYVKQCVRGIEIKAHDYAPAARRVVVIGLTCESNVRNFECRHVGFRFDDEEISTSAKDVTFIGCTSITPTKRTGLGTSPRAMSIHSYDTVDVKDFTVQGAGELQTSGDEEDINFSEEFLPGAVNTGADTITVVSNVDTWITGQPVRYDQGDTAVGGLTDGVFYYVVRIDETTIKLTATMADAIAGTNLINLTSQGTGTHTLVQLQAPIMVGVHFKARNITFDGLHFRACVGAAELLRFTGSMGKNITLRNITASDCEGVVVSGSGSIAGVSVKGIKADTTVSPQPSCIFRMTYTPTKQTYDWEGIEGTGYAANTIIGAAGTSISTGFDSRGLKGFAAASNTTSVANRGVILASTTGTASAGGAIIACTSSPVASGDKSMVAASSGGTASGERATIVGGATDCTASGMQSAILSSTNSTSSATAASVVVASNRVINSVSYSLTLGYAASGDRLSANRTIELAGNGGTIKHTGTITSSTTFADWAEMMENLEHGVIPLGTIVTLVDDKVRPAAPGDRITGVVSATAASVFGDSPFAWSQRYLVGEFGELLYEMGPDPNWPEMVPQPGWDGPEDRAPMVPNPVPAPIVKLFVENPDFDPTLPNTPRSERPEEWSVVAMGGKVHVRVGEDVEPGDFVAADGDVSGEPTRLQCMKIVTPYDEAKGYAVAWCLLI